MSCSMRCRYYTETFLGWCLNNKTIVVLSLLSFCLFVSVLVIARQRNNLRNEINAITSTVAPTEASSVNTAAPAETSNVTTDPTTVETTTNGTVTENGGEDGGLQPPEGSVVNKLANSRLMKLMEFATQA
ncbi:hypothetical protein O0L34_g15519 [Tuta absoluta]|nr:hypothetical protein O0L34_g15519 [Tuta absoluta]